MSSRSCQGVKSENYHHDDVLCKVIVLSAVDNYEISHGIENVETDFARFIFKEPTTLKLREKFFSFSGDDCRFL